MMTTDVANFPSAGWSNATQPALQKNARNLSLLPPFENYRVTAPTVRRLPRRPIHGSGSPDTARNVREDY